VPFEFSTAGRIVFGDGVLGQLGSLATGLGRHALVVTGRSEERGLRASELLAEAGIASTAIHVVAEPTTEDARGGVEFARTEGCDFVVSIGGGSAVDLGKAIAALVANEGDALDYLEVVGKGRKLDRAPVPFVAIPTTAGTGSEVTRNAVLDVPERGVKVSLRSPMMLPRIALVDPTLTHGVPPDVTASTGFDALSQVIEPYVSRNANPLTDGLSAEALVRSARSLARAYQNGRDAAAREDLSFVSLVGGIALANAKLGAVHGFAGPLGGMYHAPHGAICAALLPHVMHVNLRALRERAPNSDPLARFARVAAQLTGRPDARPEDAIGWIGELAAALHIAPLASYGCKRTDFPLIAEKAKVASSMQGNPVELSSSELHEILDRAF
jgi:alcohol dehydrogenase class IV